MNRDLIRPFTDVRTINVADGIKRIYIYEYIYNICCHRHVRYCDLYNTDRLVRFPNFTDTRPYCVRGIIQSKNYSNYYLCLQKTDIK